MSGRVGVLHHRRAFFPPTLRDMVAGAADLVWVLVDEDRDDLLTRRLVERLGDVVEIASDDLDQAARTLSQARLDGIITFVDDHLTLTAELAQRLGLIHHDPRVAAVIHDKARQRAALAAAGVPGPRFWRLPGGLDDDALASIAADAVYPAVLKPVHGSASRGIVGVANGDELLRLYDDDVEQLLEEHLLDDPRSDPRFASYLSVESVVSHGRIAHVALTGRFPLAEPYRETGNFVPASVPSGQRDQILAVATAAITALQVRDAVVHVEIKLTPDGPRLIEVNGRLGGRPPFLLVATTGINLFQVACRIALGERIRIEAPIFAGIGFWRMMQPPLSASRVLGIDGVSALRAMSWVDSVNVQRGAGQRVDAQDGTDGAVVAVTGRVGTLAELERAIALIDRSVGVEYELAESLVAP